MVLQFVGSPSIALELLYASIVIIACLFIYKRTKELEELTNHTGIHYFKNTFLFFAIAYGFRLIIRLFLLSLEIPQSLAFRIQSTSLLVILVFVYATSAAVFYLVYSATWRKLPPFLINHDYLLHFVSLLIATLTIVFKTPFIFLIIQTLLILYALIETHRTQRKTKIASPFKIIYFLLFLFAVRNIVDIVIPHVLQTVKTGLDLAAAGIFLIILYKVLEKTKTK